MQFNRLSSILLHLSLTVILAGAAITWLMGEKGQVSLIVGYSSREAFGENGELIELPFTLRLDDCGTEFHTGTVTARDYFAAVTVLHDDGPTQSQRISMNSPMKVDGYSFCMASMGNGRCTLSVNHDPWGVGVSFAGYYLLFASMALLLVIPKGGFRRRLRTVSAMLLLLIVADAEAAPKVLQRPLARTFGELYVDVNGRVCPMQTLARDFTLKVAGTDHYDGLTPEQFLTGWLFYYDDWKNEPVVKLKSREARELMGTDRVSLSQLYEGGVYKLEPLLNAPRVSASLRADDEKVGFISSVCTGAGLKIIPVRRDGNSLQWQSWVENLPPDEYATFTPLIALVFEQIHLGLFREANTTLQSIKSAQIATGGSLLPSGQIMAAERLYNGTFHPLACAIAAILIGMVALCAVSGGIHQLKRATLFIAIPLLAYVTYLIGMRWYISGHVPLSSGFETMQSVAWVALVLALVCYRRILILYPMGLIVGGAALMVAMIGVNNPSVSHLMPVLESRLLSLHVMLVMASYALFAIIALNSLWALTFGRDNRAQLTNISMAMLYPAVFMLGAGIFVGAIWAEHSWGRYWGWDPKETWALITFIVYVVPFHTRYLKPLRSPIALNAYLAAAFISVLITYFGVNFFMTGLHSYAT